MTEPTTPPPGQWASPRAAPGDASGRLSGRKVLVAFVVVVGAFLLLALLGAVLSDAPEPPPGCPTGQECGGPPAISSLAPAAVVSFPPTSPSSLPPDTIGIRAGEPWTSSELGYEFEYPSDWWKISDQGPRGVGFGYLWSGADAQLIVAAVPAAEASAQALSDRWFADLQAWAPDLEPDTTGKNAILGPEIGFVDGLGSTYAGSVSNPQGGTRPVGVSVVVASDGRTTVAVILIVANPDQAAGDLWVQHVVRADVELVLKTFRWGTGT